MTVRFGQLATIMTDNLGLVTQQLKIEQFRLLIPPRIRLPIFLRYPREVLIPYGIFEEDGTVWATGQNNNGELGNGGTGNVSRAVQVTDSSGNYITNISAISVGSDHSVFLKMTVPFGQLVTAVTEHLELVARVINKSSSSY